MTYGALVKNVQEPKKTGTYSWGGFVTGNTPLDAASVLAVSVEGYDVEQYEDREELVEQFVNDGWRFKIFEVGKEWDNSEIG